MHPALPSARGSAETKHAESCRILRFWVARAHLDKAFTGRIQGAAGLIEQQQAGVACQGSCDAHTLLLTPAQGDAPCIPQLQHKGPSVNAQQSVGCEWILVGCKQGPH